MRKLFNFTQKREETMETITAEDVKSTLKAGFTLIELMVVVVIIGILAALAIPKFLGATDKAKLSEASLHAKSIGTQMEVYKVETGVYPSSIEKLDYYVENGNDSTSNYFAYDIATLNGTISVYVHEAFGAYALGDLVGTYVPLHKGTWTGDLEKK